MGIITLTIKKGTDINMTTGSVRKPGNLTHKTTYWERSVTDTHWGDQKAAADIKFKLNMTNIRFDKKMYSPNEIVADIQLSVECAPNKIRKAFISKSDLDTIFVNKQVKLVCDETIVCDDYYVHEVIPRRYKDEMWVTLKIYSPDKLMTLKPGCSAFVAQELSSIVEKEKTNYAIPYLTTYKQNEKGEMVIDTTTPVGIDCSNMQNLKQVKDGATSEHIFPYLVQYNESFYDFLARTANRWGEFMYYESNKLNIGNTAPAATTSTKDSISGYSLLTWHNLADKELDDKTTYGSEAFPDKNLLDNVIVRDKYDEVRGTLENAGDLEKGADTFWMSKVAQVFGNDKNMSQFALDALIDDTMTIAQTHARVDKNNSRINEKYLKYDDAYEDTAHTKKKPQYEVEDKIVTQFNQFSEMNPIVDATKYGTILKGELEAGKNAIKVEYDTKFPGLKLGSIITFESKQYIVIEVEGYQPEVINKNDNGYYEHAYKTSEVRYRITAIASQGTAFYPMMLPSGHIRKSGPKIAVVVDVDDPLRCNRVRVKFPWQLTTFNKDYEKISADDLNNQTDTQKAESTPSPWLIYASASGPKGAGIHGRHYLAEKVLVDFADGNVERPYVVGAVSRDVPGGVKTGSAVLAAPNGESIKVHEGTGLGVAAFLGSMNPGLKFIRGFVGPFGQDIIWKNNEACLEGGVDISDKYGIWSIKGSTHDRNISIKSPWGDVKIDAFTGITISAPNGDVKIKGKNVSIEAGNNLTLTSGKNIKNQLFPSLGKNPISGEDAGSWFAELFGGQIFATATSKIASLGLNFFDLSMLRNVFEVFLRPDEGLLEIKSNRYMKLEAGKGNAYYPDDAYRDWKKSWASIKERNIKTSRLFVAKNMLSDVEKLLSRIEPFVYDYSNILVSRYNDACEAKNTMDKELSNLKAIIGQIDPIDTQNYKKMLEEAWNQDVSLPYVDLADGDIKFHASADINPQDSNLKKLSRLFCVRYINSFRKMIYALMSTAHSADFFKNSGKNYLKIESYGFSKKTIMSIAASLDTNAFQTIGTFTNAEKMLGSKLQIDTFRTRERTILRRTIALVILEALGFDDVERAKDAQGKIPEKPKSNDLDGPKWNDYIGSIRSIPGLSADRCFFVKKNVKALNQVWDNLAIWRPFSEYAAWSDNANGEILFSSDNKTYKLGCQNEPRPGSHATGAKDFDEYTGDNKVIADSIRNILTRL